MTRAAESGGAPAGCPLGAATQSPPGRWVRAPTPRPCPERETQSSKEITLHFPCANCASTGWRHGTLSAELTRVRNLPAQRNFPSVAQGVTGGGGPYAAALATPPGQVFPGLVRGQPHPADHRRALRREPGDRAAGRAAHRRDLDAVADEAAGARCRAHRPQGQPRHCRVRRLVPGRLESLRSDGLCHPFRLELSAACAVLAAAPGERVRPAAGAGLEAGSEGPLRRRGAGPGPLVGRAAAARGVPAGGLRRGRPRPVPRRHPFRRAARQRGSLFTAGARF